MRISVLFFAYLVLVAIAYASTWMSWRLGSGYWLEAFGPRKDGEKWPISAEQVRRRGVISEASRAILVAFVSFFVVMLFYKQTYPWEPLMTSAQHLISWLSIAIVSVLWLVVKLPRDFALAADGERSHLLSRTVLTNYVGPYTAWVPYFLSVYLGMGWLLVISVANGAAMDYQRFTGAIRDLQAPDIDTLAALQTTSLQLSGFGKWIAASSQKYLLAGLVIVIYLIVEQRTFMKDTITNASLDRLKSAVLIMALTTFVIGGVLLPASFISIHTYTQRAASALNSSDLSPEELLLLMETSTYLEDHDLGWLLVIMLTGYGNLLAVLTLAGGFSVRYLLFKDIPLYEVLELLLPTFIHGRVISYLGNIGVNFNPPSKHSRVNDA